MEGIYAGCFSSAVVSAATDGGDGAGAVTEAVRVVGAAVGHPVVEVAAGLTAVLQGTQGAAGVVAYAALVAVSAVDHAVVAVTSRRGAIRNGAHRNRGLDRLLSGGIPAGPSPVTAVGGGGDRQRQNQQKAQKGGRQTTCSLHRSTLLSARRLRDRVVYYSALPPGTQGKKWLRPGGRDGPESHSCGMGGIIVQ